MSVLFALRLIFAAMVGVGLIVNVSGLFTAIRIRERLIRAKKNGLKHQSASNLNASAQERLFNSFMLAIILAVVFAADARVSHQPEERERPLVERRDVPPVRRNSDLAIIARLAFIGLAVNSTAGALRARSGRIKTELLIEAEEAEEAARAAEELGR